MESAETLSADVEEEPEELRSPKRASNLDLLAFVATSPHASANKGGFKKDDDGEEAHEQLPTPMMMYGVPPHVMRTDGSMGAAAGWMPVDPYMGRTFTQPVMMGHPGQEMLYKPHEEGMKAGEAGWCATSQGMPAHGIVHAGMPPGMCFLPPAGAMYGHAMQPMQAMHGAVLAGAPAEGTMY